MGCVKSNLHTPSFLKTKTLIYIEIKIALWYIINNMPDDKGTNITPLLDHIFSVGDIKTKNELQALIDALNKFPDDTKLDPKNLAILMEEIKKNRQS